MKQKYHNKMTLNQILHQDNEIMKNKIKLRSTWNNFYLKNKSIEKGANESFQVNKGKKSPLIAYGRRVAKKRES